MTKVFNTHIEAGKYLWSNPEVNKIKSNGGSTLYLNEKGDLIVQHVTGTELALKLSDYTTPFTAVECEKDNEELAIKLNKIWDRLGSVAMLVNLFEIMDEKIKKAKING